jgi:hypothetical protein
MVTVTVTVTVMVMTMPCGVCLGRRRLLGAARGI